LRKADARPIDEGAGGGRDNEGAAPNLATSSIICFSVTVPDWNGARRRLDEEECRMMFQLLNTDVSQMLDASRLPKRSAPANRRILASLCL
jgi:hypothetical protein